jgi:hypothetical protein
MSADQLLDLIGWEERNSQLTNFKQTLEVGQLFRSSWHHHGSLPILL